jgi:hypothetical protein
MSGIDAVLISIIPSIGVGLIFWYVMRAIIRADRRERAELAKIDAEEDARAAAASGNTEAKRPAQQ